MREHEVDVAPDVTWDCDLTLLGCESGLFYTAGARVSSVISLT